MVWPRFAARAFPSGAFGKAAAPRFCFAPGSAGNFAPRSARSASMQGGRRGAGCAVHGSARRFAMFMAGRGAAPGVRCGVWRGARVRRGGLYSFPLGRCRRIRRGRGDGGHENGHRQHNEESSPAHGGGCGHPEQLQCTSIRLRARVPSRIRMCLIRSSGRQSAVGFPFTVPGSQAGWAWRLDAPRGESLVFFQVNPFRVEEAAGFRRARISVRAFPPIRP